jgi:hypothetical protein
MYSTGAGRPVQSGFTWQEGCGAVQSRPSPGPTLGVMTCRHLFDFPWACDDDEDELPPEDAGNPAPGPRVDS